MSDVRVHVPVQVGGLAVAIAVSVTVVEVHEDGRTTELDPETGALLAGLVGQFSSMPGWAVDGAGGADHGDREATIGHEGRELQRTLLETTFALDAAREQRIDHLVPRPGSGTAASRRATTGGW
jgi:hypothetical protein